MAERTPIHQPDSRVVSCDMDESDEPMQEQKPQQKTVKTTRRQFLRSTAAVVSAVILNGSSWPVAPAQTPSVDVHHNHGQDGPKREILAPALMPQNSDEAKAHPPIAALNKPSRKIPEVGGFVKLTEVEEDIKKEIDQYGEFALGNRGNLTQEYILKLLQQRKATYSNLDEMSEKMTEWEIEYKIGAEYVITLLAQENNFGRDIEDGTANIAGKDNWINYRPPGNHEKKFPDWEAGVLDNIETAFWQLDKYHRRGIQTTEPPPKFYHTWRQMLPIFAQPEDKSWLQDRIDDGETYIQQMREESKKMSS
jgi:hypothetical protein